MYAYKLDLFDQDNEMGFVLHNRHGNKKLLKIYVMVDILLDCITSNYNLTYNYILFTNINQSNVL